MGGVSPLVVVSVMPPNCTLFFRLHKNEEERSSNTEGLVLRHLPPTHQQTLAQVIHSDKEFTRSYTPYHHSHPLTQTN